MKPNLTKLENLTDQQLHTVSTDVEIIGFRQASAKATSELGRDIDTSTVQRFVARGSAKEFLDETPDTAAAATEILRYAATGIPNFTDATVQVLDQTAFKLSLVCTRTEEEMKALTQVNTMLHRHRSQSVRERMAAVQERKAKLREQELELRRSKNPDRNPHHPPQSDSLGDLVLTGDDIERRTCTKFNLKYEPSDDSPALGRASAPSVDSGAPPESSLGRDIGQPGSGFHGVPNIEKPVAAPRECAALQNEGTSNISIPQIEETHQIEPASSLPPVSDSQKAVATEIRAAAFVPASIERTSLSEIPEPEPSDSKSEILNPNSEMELYRQTEKNSEPPTSSSLSSIKELKLVAPKLGEGGREAPHSTSDLELRPSDLIVCHAIRRWRSYHPRYYWNSEPTNSWNDECPCGSKIPCEQHPELWGRVRYTKPSDPAYVTALKENGIPIYIPTEEELTRPEPTDVPCNSPMWAKKPVPQQLTHQNDDKDRPDQTA